MPKEFFILDPENTIFPNLTEIFFPTKDCYKKISQIIQIIEKWVKKMGPLGGFETF